jgi:DNA-binding transcriptional LysR family regulator
MELRHLRAFVAVAEHGTVSKAAEILRITQPALSRQISSLEHHIGIPLFERVARRLLLTPRGEQLLSESRNLLAGVATFDERVQALRRGDIEVLKVTASALTIEAIFPAALRLHAERHPDLRLAVIEAHATEHLNMLESGSAHLAVNVIDVLPVDADRFASRLLPSFQLLAAFAPALGIAQADGMEIAEVVRHPLLVLDQTYATRHVFDAACRLVGVKPSISFASGSARALLSMAEAGHGLAIVPSILRIDSRHIRTVPVTHRRKPLPLTPAVLWDKRRVISRYGDGFADALTAHIRAAFPATRPPRRGSTARK